MSAAEIVRRLGLRYAGKEWLTFRELRPGPGFISHGWIDFAALHAWGHTHRRDRQFLIAVEVKVDRADWRRELAKPEKSEFWTSGVAAQFFVAAPRGVVPVEELPVGWGLLEAVGDADGLRIARAAAPNPDAKIPEGTWLMMLRALRDGIEAKDGEMRGFASFAGRPISLDDLDKLAQHRHCHTCANGIEHAAIRLNAERRRGAKENWQWVEIERRWRMWIEQAFGYQAPRTPEQAHRLMGSMAQLVRMIREVHGRLGEVAEAIEKGRSE